MIKVSRDENSPKKKRRLENEEIQKLKKGQECFMQWPMRIGERFYDCPIKVAPDLFINLTTEKNIEGFEVEKSKLEKCHLCQNNDFNK